MVIKKKLGFSIQAPLENMDRRNNISVKVILNKRALCEPRGQTLELLQVIFACLEAWGKRLHSLGSHRGHPRIAPGNFIVKSLVLYPPHAIIRRLQGYGFN